MWTKFETAANGAVDRVKPKLNTVYLVTDAHGQVGIGYFLGGAAWGTSGCGANVVAWAELPAPFKEADENVSVTKKGSK
jgi:hypothetical protein